MCTWQRRRRRRPKIVDTDKESEWKKNEKKTTGREQCPCGKQLVMLNNKECLCVCDITNIGASAAKKEFIFRMESMRAVFIHIHIHTQRFTSNVTFFRMICRSKTRMGSFCFYFTFSRFKIARNERVVRMVHQASDQTKKKQRRQKQSTFSNHTIFHSINFNRDNYELYTQTYDIFIHMYFVSFSTFARSFHITRQNRPIGKFASVPQPNQCDSISLQWHSKQRKRRKRRGKKENKVKSLVFFFSYSVCGSESRF